VRQVIEELKAFSKGNTLGEDLTVRDLIEEGRRFWLFRAGFAASDPPPRWFVHGLFA